MYVRRALSCLFAIPLVCVALAASVRAQGFEGPVSLGGPGIGGGSGDG